MSVEGFGEVLLAMKPEVRREYLRSRTVRDRMFAEYALARHGVGWRTDPITWTAHLDGHLYQPRRYMPLLAAAFRRAVFGIEPRQMWMMPSRYGKTFLASQRGPSWALDLDPTANIILTSYGDELAVENSIAVRDYLTLHAARLQVRLRRTKGDRFSTTKGGGLLASGRAGGIIGFGAGGGEIGAGGGVIMDDMFRNWQDAHSTTTRDFVWNMYRSVLSTRLNDSRAFKILVGTRWHEDDLQGRILRATAAGDEDPWTVYRLPALAEAPDPKAGLDYLNEPDLLGRAPGEPLDPTYRTREHVLDLHRVLGSYLTAGMEQQRPSPEEGGEIKRAWWRFGTAPTSDPDDGLTSWDMKLKDKTGGDFVVGGVWKRWGPTAWLVDFYRGQFPFVTTKTAIALAAVRHPRIRRHVIENTGNGPEVIAALRRPTPGATVDDSDAGLLGATRDECRQIEALLARGLSGIIPETPVGDKTARARATSPFIQAGDVWIDVVHEMGWGLTVVNEHAQFPGGHDDIVDMTSQALRLLLGVAPMTTSLPSGRVILPGPAHVRLPTYS